MVKQLASGEAAAGDTMCMGERMSVYSAYIKYSYPFGSPLEVVMFLYYNIESTSFNTAGVVCTVCNLQPLQQPPPLQVSVELQDLSY